MPPPTQAAEGVEIEVSLNTSSQAPTRTRDYNVTATCVVGTNSWFITGNFLLNASADYWRVGTNVVEHRVITSSMYPRQAKELVADKLLRRQSRVAVLSYPPVGEHFVRVHPSGQGQPAGVGVAKVVWLAFCSGAYLKQHGREIPLPLALPSEAFGYSDSTAVFEDELGLPRSMKLYAADSEIACEYEALQTTNVLGRTYPLKFRLVHYELPPGGGPASGFTSVVQGTVTSIRPGREPLLPEELRMKLNVPGIRDGISFTPTVLLSDTPAASK